MKFSAKDSPISSLSYHDNDEYASRIKVATIKRMRIGIYDPYLDDLGGGEKYMMTLASCLANKHEVFVFWDNNEDIKKIQERFSLNLNSINIVKNIFASNFSFKKRLFETGKYDVLIVLSDGSIPITLANKLILHVQQPLQTPVVRTWKNKLKLMKVSSVFYNSEYTMHYNKNLFTGVKNEIIYPPVSIVYHNLPKENIILHVGRFRLINGAKDDYKKQQVMISTFKNMIDKGLKKWKFVIATSIQNEDDPSFQSMLQSVKGYPIEFEVNKSNQTLWEIYSKSKIYWHASGYGEDLNKHPEHAEHFGISTVEAMGAGVVPIVINAGGQKEIITDGLNGLLWETLEELQEQTSKIINSESLFKKLSKEAQHRAHDFSYESFCKRVNGLIS